jgi:hypothetical protein
MKKRLYLWLMLAFGFALILSGCGGGSSSGGGGNPGSGGSGNAVIKVTDGTNPLSGAVVSVMVNGTANTVTTNASGEATFSDLPAGAHTFTASMADYPDNTVSVTVTNKQTATATIVLSRDKGNTSVAVTISDGASVIPAFTIDGITRTPNIINGNTYTFNNLTIGSHIIAASTDYYTASNTSNVDVIKGATTSGPSITLNRDKVNAVIILTMLNSPQSDWSIKLNGTTITTDINGQAMFNNLSAGAYSVTASKSANINLTITSSVTITKSDGDNTINASDYYNAFRFNITNETGNPCYLTLATSDLSKSTIIYNGKGSSEGVFYVHKDNWKWYYDGYSNSKMTQLKLFPTTNDLVIQ